MVTLRIILKEFLQQTRDWKANGLMLLFPLLLMAILGAALNGTFGGMSSIPRVSAQYSIDEAGPLAAAFTGFVRQASSTGVSFTKSASDEAGLQSVRNADTAAYIVVNSGGIKLYRNARYPVEAGIVRSILAAFLLRYNAVLAIHEMAPAGRTSPPHSAGGPAAPGQTAGESGATLHPASPAPAAGLPAAQPPAAGYVRTQSIGGGRSPSALDYYAVTMLTLIILYSSLIGARMVRTEQRLGTASRILCAPVGRVRYISGKVLGLLLTLAVQMTLLLAFSHYILGAYWGSHLLPVAAIILAESLMIVSVGVGIGYLVPSEAASAAVLNTVIPFFAFFSGTYVPMSLMGPVAERIGSYSPLKWVNDALFGIIYQSDYSSVGRALLLNLGVAVVFIAIAALLARREAYR